MIYFCFSLIYTMLQLIICFLLFFKHLLILSICIPLGSYNTTMFIFQMSYYLLYTKLLVLISGDIETNPGPISSIIQSLSICHWNLNSISTYNFTSISYNSFIRYCVSIRNLPRINYFK